MNQYNVPCRLGRAPTGDSLDELKDKAQTWLEANAVDHNIMFDVTYIGQLCKEHGHHILMTSPYHPELQAIEKVWRNVKMYVARRFAGTRTMAELWAHVREAFLKYGTAAHCASSCIAEAHKFEVLYRTPGAHKLSVQPEDADASAPSSWEQSDFFSSDEELD